ncbi:MAG: F0F1 ATP synthase subunit epsilon [Bryobacteraceae bacterium]|nr:F0F1 ATP synthase subunit epsilon [Bryobacteraceae bacterium]
MAGALTLEIATPERLLLREQVSEVVLPGASGALGILPEHAPLLTELGPGELAYVPEGGQRKFIAIRGGWAEVLPDHVRVIATGAEFGDEIDVKRAEEALKRAEMNLSSAKEDLDTVKALNKMRRAQARLETAKHSGHHRP